MDSKRIQQQIINFFALYEKIDKKRRVDELNPQKGKNVPDTLIYPTRFIRNYSKYTLLKFLLLKGNLISIEI